jgi:glutathione S-transferase
MKLLGSKRSPYVRRVGVSLNVMGLDYTLDPVAVWDNPEEVSAHNPLVRVPTVVLDDGDTLVESYAILDALDEMAGDDKRLIPASGPDRRKVMKMTAVASGTIDKTIWAVYEGRFHPKEKVHRPWIEHNEPKRLAGRGLWR